MVPLSLAILGHDGYILFSRLCFLGVMRVPFRVEILFILQNHRENNNRQTSPSPWLLDIHFFFYNTNHFPPRHKRRKKRRTRNSFLEKRTSSHFNYHGGFISSQVNYFISCSWKNSTLKNEREEMRLSFISETKDPESCRRNKRWKRVKIPSVTKSNRRRSQNLGLFLLEMLFHIPSQDRHRALAHVVRSLTHNRSTASHIRFLLVGSSLPILRWKSSSSLTLMILYLLSHLLLLRYVFLVFLRLGGSFSFSFSSFWFFWGF